MTFPEMLRAWWRLRLLKTVGLSIDITDRCPLSCAGCYMKWYAPNEDLPVERWEEIIQSFPASQRVFCAWTGGEPLLRADDVRALSRHFAWNWVATNGTVPIPDIPRTTMFVSVDGPKEIHDSLRAPRRARTSDFDELSRVASSVEPGALSSSTGGGWDEIVRHVRPEHYVACTVRRENSSPGALRELTEFWYEKARGIVFGFLTPRRRRRATEDTELTEGNDSAVRGRLPCRSASVPSVTSVARAVEGQALDREERRAVLRTLRELRRDLGRFVLGVGGQVDDCARTAWREKCPAEAALVTFDAGGRRKKPCTLGSEVDCSRCGCAVPGFLRRVRRLHVPTLAEVARLFRG